MNNIMTAVFLFLAAAMMYTVLVRLFFHVSYREPDGDDLNQFLDNCRSSGPLRPSGFLGWIDELLAGVDFDRQEFRRSVEHFRRRAEWCHALQRILGAQATAIGMLFTLVSLTTAATGTLDPTVVIAVGVMSSVYGLVIAVPGTTLHDIFQSRVDRFVAQAEAVLEALDAAPRAVAKTVHQPASKPIAALAGWRYEVGYRGYQGEGLALRELPVMIASSNFSELACDWLMQLEMKGAGHD